jgi:ribonuclease PH
MPNTSRIDSRKATDLRPVEIESHVQMHAEGSVIITLGQTRVLCAVSIENRVPRFLRGTGAGWVTAEYAMLPRATNTRSDRDSMRSSGRTHEIQRLIGRSLRAVTDLDILGERTFTVDCDVLQADGGTRTAAITGGYVALHHAMQRLVTAGEYTSVPLRLPVAATSVGVVQGEVLLDLCYEEDSGADVDLNVVKTGDGEYIEVQGTAEGSPFSRKLLNEMLDVADAGLDHLFEVQRQEIANAAAP